MIEDRFLNFLKILFFGVFNLWSLFLLVIMFFINVICVGMVVDCLFIECYYIGDDFFFVRFGFVFEYEVKFFIRELD